MRAGLETLDATLQAMLHPEEGRQLQSEDGRLSSIPMQTVINSLIICISLYIPYISNLQDTELSETL